MMLPTIWRTLVALIAAIVCVQAQTRTVIDPNSGNTVVQVVTTVLDPALGVGVATTLVSTVRPSTVVPSTAVQTRPPVYDPVVGAPQATQSAVETPYWVSTTIGGVSTVQMYTFTPTFAPSSAPLQYSQGSVMNYNEWTSQYATRTVAPPNGVARFAVISLSTVIALAGGVAIALT